MCRSPKGWTRVRSITRHSWHSRGDADPGEGPRGSSEDPRGCHGARAGQRARVAAAWCRAPAEQGIRPGDRGISEVAGDSTRPDDHLQRWHRVREKERPGPRLRVAGESEGDEAGRHELHAGRQRSRRAARRSALREAAAGERGFRQSVRRRDEDPRRVARRGHERPVRVDRACGWRCRQGRCQRFRHVRSIQEYRQRVGCRSHLPLFDEDRPLALAGGRRRQRSTRSHAGSCGGRES